ncbi:hypothetical protein PV-S19_0144 [Pacmanvirus S19]|nr:hypothetical protein PV-S19_0144 [Pacmanvirus S19]
MENIIETLVRGLKCIINITIELVQASGAGHDLEFVRIPESPYPIKMTTCGMVRIPELPTDLVTMNPRGVYG